MKTWIIIISIIVGIVYIFYKLYFADYTKVRKVFHTLRKFLDARDSIVLKLVPDIKDEQLSKEVIKQIEERKLNFSSGQNNAILSDIKLNATLKRFYEKYNLLEKNELEKEIFSSALKAEQNLKHLRKEYNLVVQNYNQHLIKHKIVCFKIIKMKPLDTYDPLGTRP